MVRIITAPALTALILVCLAVLTPCLLGQTVESGLGETAGPDSPEQPVINMLDALKEEDWEKAVSCIDIAGIIEEAKAYVQKASEDLPEDKKEALQKELAQLTIEKVTKSFIEKMKDTFGSDFEYTILTTQSLNQDNAVVIVELRREGNAREDHVPVARIDGTWKVSFRNLVESSRPKGKD